MIQLQQLKGKNHTKEPYSDFIAGYGSLVTHDLGVSSDADLNVYAVSVGDLTEKPVVFIECGIHGQHEWTSGYWLREFMHMLHDPSSTPYPEVFWKLRSKFSFFAIPILNPWGYVYGPSEHGSKENAETRNNKNGVNLNRNFDAFWEENTDPSKGSEPFSEPEAKMVRDAVQLYKPIMFLDYHTWGIVEDLSGKFSSGSKNLKQHDFMIRDIADTIMYNTEENWIVDGFGGGDIGRPTSQDWAALQVSKTGKNTLSLSPEVSAGFDFETQMRMGVNSMLYVCLHLLEWYEKGNVRT